VTRRQELVVAAVGAMVMLVVATLLLVRPIRQATAEARAEREAAITESQSLRDQIKALEALKPNEAELKAKASLAGVELGTVAPTTPKASTVNPLLAEITTTVNVSGGYFEIQDFLVRLESLVKGSDPGRVDPRSVLIQSVNLTSGSEGATGDSAAATADATTAPDELQGNIVLTVFQLAQPTGTSSSPAAPATTAGQGPPVR
jgi:hypothetical protein